MCNKSRGHWLPYLEWMVTTSCDLACPGCDRFIDYQHNWTEDFDILSHNMKAWSNKLDPDNFTIIGGEPLIHPRIYDIIEESRKHFDHAKIEIYTNGFLLPKKKNIFKFLKKLGNCKVSITLHNRDEKLRNLIWKNIYNYFLNLDNWRQVKEHHWISGSIEFEVTDTTKGGWYDYRQKINGKLKPWNDRNPESSYKNCGVNIYPIIYNNRLYKCPPISMVRTHAEKYNLMDDDDWKPYVEYSGLGLDCSEEELEEFIENIMKPHSICAMCPANPLLKPQKEAVVRHDLEKLL